MVHASDLPPIHPQWSPRQMTPREVIDLSHHIDVPGVNTDDPVVQALRRANLGVFGHIAINEAKERRALILKREVDSKSWHGSTRYVWGWWCAAAKWPEVIAQANGESYRVTVDLAPMERTWSLHALPRMGQLLEQCGMVEGFLIGEDTLDVDGVEILTAIQLAASLVELIRDRRNVADRRKHR